MICSLFLVGILFGTVGYCGLRKGGCREGKSMPLFWLELRGFGRSEATIQRTSCGQMGEILGLSSDVSSCAFHCDFASLWQK